MKDFRTLSVWQKSHKLAVLTYQLTNKFPKEELYGIISQLRRAAVSIPTNIAEGCGRGSDKDFARFIQIALGSASEAEYLVLLSHDLGYLNSETEKELTDYICEVKKMLTSLLKSLQNTSRPLKADR
jgi:four helix bundle protein